MGTVLECGLSGVDVQHCRATQHVWQASAYISQDQQRSGSLSFGSTAGFHVYQATPLLLLFAFRAAVCLPVAAVAAVWAPRFAAHCIFNRR
jgi:hypothetical protein